MVKLESFTNTQIESLTSVPDGTVLYDSTNNKILVFESDIYKSVLDSDTTIGFVEGVTAGTATANKALVVDINKSVVGIGTIGLDDITITDTITLGGVLVSSTGTELNYLSGITAGVVSNSKALVASSGGSISGINSISVDTIVINGNTINGTNSAFLTSITPGTVYATKALITNSDKEISGLAKITTNRATSGYSLYGISGTLEYGLYNTLNSTLIFGTVSNNSFAIKTNDISRINVTNDGNIDILSHNGTTSGLMLNSVLVTATADELNYLNTTPGTADVEKALVLDLSGEIAGITSLSATTLLGTLGTAAQTSITSVGTLTGLTVSGATSITNTTESTTTSSGALIVSGGVGIAKNLNVLGNIVATGTITGTLATAAQTSITSIGTLTGLTVSGATNITNTTESTTTSTGALIVSGGVGIAKRLNVLGNTSLTGTLLTSGVSTLINTSLNTSTNYNGVMDTASLVIRQSNNVNGNKVSIDFSISTNIIDAINTATCSISHERIAVYQGDLIFSTKRVATATSALVEALRISSTGSCSIANTSNSDFQLNLGSSGTGINTSSITSTSITGTIITAAQANITSVGALNSLILTPTTRVLSAGNTSTNCLWASSSDRRFGMRQPDTNNIVLLCYSSGGTYIDFITWDHNSGVPLMNISASVTMVNLTTTGPTSITNTTESTTTSTGALIVSGGVGIAKNLNVLGNTVLTGTLTTTGTITGTLATSAQTSITSVGTLTGLTVSGATSITNVTESTNTSTGALIVSGGVGIAKNLNVLGNTAITGTLSVTGTITGTLATSAQASITSVGTLTGLTVSGATSITNVTESTTTSTGALIVSGGVGIAKNLNVLGNTAITGTLSVTGTITGTLATAAQTSITSIGTLTGLTVSGATSITNTTESTTTSTGALIVSGGVGIAKNLNVLGNTVLTGTLTTTGTITGTLATSAQTSITSVGTLTGLTVSGDTSITNTTESTTTSTGALIVSGGVGIAKNLNVLGNTDITGTLTTTGTITGTLATAAQTAITSVGTLTGLTVSGTLNATDYQLSGTSLLMSSLTSVVAGTAAASKAIVLDANANITSGFNSMLISGTTNLASDSVPLSIRTTAASWGLSVSNAGTIKTGIRTDGGIGTITNNDLVFYTNSSSEDLRIYTNGNIKATGSGYIEANSFRMVPTTRDISSFLANVGVLWHSTTDRFYGMRQIDGDNISLLSYGAGGNYSDYFTWNHNAGSPIVNIKTRFINVGPSNTDNTRMLSLLDGVTTTNSNRHITLGSTNTSGNQAEIMFNYQGSNNSLNRLALGFHSKNSILNVMNSKSVNINKTTASNAVLDIQCVTEFISGGYNQAASFYSSNGSGPRVDILVSSTNTSSSASPGWIGTATTHDFRIGSNNSTRMTVEAGGNVSVTNTIDANRVRARATNSAACYIGGWDDTNYWGLGETGATNAIRIGICDISGGWLSGRAAVSAGTYTNDSDYRLKENINELEYGLKDIIKLEPKKYNFIGEEKLDQGFIAHEIQELIPEVVLGEKDAVDKDGKPIYQSVNYIGLIPILVNAIKELNKKNDELKNLVLELLEK